MTNGKIIYTPIETKGVVLDGAHYLSLSETSFNFGADDWGVDALVRVDPAVADSECWLVAKGVLDLAGAAGWHFYYKPGTRRLGLRINDGGVAAVVVETANNAIPGLGTHFWSRSELDRTNGLARFYVDGVLAGSGDISAVTGSLDNAAPLLVGAYDASNHRHKGSLDFLRFDSGRILPATWHTKEWDIIRYGMPRLISDFLARWNFEESLVDDSESLFTLAWQGGGSPTYVTGYPLEQLTYIFRRNFSRLNDGPEPSWLDTDDNDRAISGAAFGYAGALKQCWKINFTLIDETQLTVFKAAEASRDKFAFFAYADEPRTFWAKFGERLSPKTLMEGWYSLAMILEEI